MAGSSLGGIIADSAVLNVPRGQHMNPFQTVLNKQKADALSNQRKAKEDSDALTSLDDYVVVDKNFLPSTAKQAVELSRDFNNKAMQLIGTPNAKNKIHDLYTKDYSVQLQMLRGANQAKLDYINADQSGKFFASTFPAQSMVKMRKSRVTNVLQSCIQSDHHSDARSGQSTVN